MEEEIPSEEVEVKEVTEEETLEQLRGEAQGSTFVRLPSIGGPAIEIEVDRYEKDENKMIKANKQEFKNKDGTGLGFCRVLYDVEGRDMTVSTFALDSKLRSVFLQHEKIKGLKLKISRPKRGVYEVEVID